MLFLKKRVIGREEAFSGELPSGGKYQIFLDEESVGTKNFSLLVNEMYSEVGSEHSHEVDHAFFILGGNGIYSIDGIDHEVKPGMALFAPTDTLHRLRKVGSEPLRYIVIYAPPGPEKELRKRGKDAFKK